MSIVMGYAAKLYRNTGDYDSPTWVEIDNAKDVTLALNADEVDVTTRAGGGHKQTEPGLIDSSVEFDINWDTDDENFSALQTAFLARTEIEVLVLDGAYTSAGSEGLRMTAKVTTFSRDEALASNLTVSVTLKPCIADNAPEWYVATT